MKKPTVAILATLDTKGHEAQFLREQIHQLGGDALVVDMGVLGRPTTAADLTREQVASAGGTSLGELTKQPSRDRAQPVMVAGAAALLRQRLDAGAVHAVLGLGGLQGTAACCDVMRTLPYGVPKLMVSTVASGNTAPYLDIKDITIMPSIGDILGLNTFTRRMLANAAGAAYGMAHVFASPAGGAIRSGARDKPLIGMTNLGVLTEGAMRAVARFAEKGYEVIVFHAVGTGGRAMEQMMREGIIGAVFDYALGEISDERFDGLRRGSPDRLTVAGSLGLPQVLVPGGTEHIGLLVPAHEVPAQWAKHRHVFHSPVVLAPRLDAGQLGEVGRIIGERLQATKGKAVMMLPLAGTSRYGIAGGPLHDPAGDAAFFAAIERHLPKTVVLEKLPHAAEAPEFVDAAVDRLIALVEGR
jgi:uncharacterized protein (UPF0261 family)